MEVVNGIFIEIMAIIALIAIIIIYTVIKTVQKNRVVISQDENESLIKTEEKNPNSDTEPIDQPNSLTPLNRKKRELAHHDKIKKEDFNRFDSVKILIAEDNVINQKVIVSLLANSGINITIANNGEEALNILENDSDFSLILMDAHMPIIDGYQATRSIRKNPNYNHIPIIALSGDTAADDIKNMLNTGMEAHLEKPLKMDALYDILYMYTVGNENKLTSKQSQNEVMDFDSNKGLDICGGDKEFYLEILNDFMSDYSDSADTLQKYINSTNRVDADKLLLDISGVAANIGADNLHEIAIDLKNSIANPKDLEYISDLQKYKRSLYQVCEAVKEYKTD